MSTIVNERDIQLQATTPRLLVVDTNYLTIIPSTNTFATTGAGIIPANVDIKSFLSGILVGTVSWNVVPTTTYSTITGGIRISGSDIPVGTSVTVTGSITFLGNVYSSSTILTHAANSAVITLDQTAANVNKSAVGVFIPATVIFSGKISDGSGSPSAYSGRFEVDITTDGISYSNLFTSVTNQSSYTYTPDISHKAVRVKLYKAGGLVTLLDQKTTTISDSGTPGADGSIYYITPSSYVLSKNQSSIFSPTSITFNAKFKQGASAATNYAGRFKIYENGSGIESYSSASNESSTNYIPTTGCTSLKCELYSADGFVTKLDEQGIVTSAAGSNAVSAILTNEAHVLPASSTGTVSTYTGSGTQIYLYEGGAPIPYDEAGYTAGNNSTWKVTVVGTGVTAGTKTDGGNYADYAQVSGVLSATETADLTFTISGRTSIGVPFSITKTQKFSKSKQGVEGPPGPTDVSGLLVLSAANILTGTVEPSNTGAIRVGSITWNSTTGALTGGTGIAMTEWGIVGASSGSATFSIQASTGAAIFRGDITGGANINITGTANFQGSTNSGGVNYCGVFNEARTVSGGVSATAGSGGFGVRGSAGTAGDIGISGTGGSATGAEGVRATQGSGSGGVALNVVGIMTMSSTVQVANLNASMVGGKNVAQLCQIVVTDSGTCTVSGNGFNLNSTVGGVGTLGAGNVVTIRSVSDERLKNTITPEVLGINFIKQLTPVTYRMNKDPSIMYHGFIAQHLGKLIEATDDSLYQRYKDGVLGTDYMSMIAPIVKALQQLINEVEILKGNDKWQET